MAQYDLPVLDPSVHTGTQLTDFLNQWASALRSNHSGAVRPSYATRGTAWVDTGVSGATIVYLFDGTTDREIGRVEAGQWRPAGAVSSSGGSIAGMITVAQNITVTPRNSATGWGGTITLQNAGGPGGDAILERQSGAFRIYTSPTAVLSMDVITGVLTVSGAISSGAQINSAAAFTRKDYVDSGLASKMSAGGGTMAGNLTIYNPTAGISAGVFMSGAGSTRQWSVENTNASGDNGRFRIVDNTLGVERVGIDQLGRMGINVSAPLGMLHVNAPSGYANIALTRADGVPVQMFYGASRTWQIYPTGAEFLFNNLQMGSWAFGIRDTGIAVRSSIELAVAPWATTTSISMGNDHSVYTLSSLGNAGGIAFSLNNSYGACAAFWPRTQFQRFMMWLGSSNEGWFGGDNNGNIAIAWGQNFVWSAGLTASDATLKLDHGNTKIDAMQIVQKLRVADFEYSEPVLKSRAPGRRSGFMAQEVRELIPQAVQALASPVQFEEGTLAVKKQPLRGTKPQEILHVHMEGMVPVLWRALQQAMERIDTLEADMADARLQLKTLTRRAPRQ